MEQKFYVMLGDVISSRNIKDKEAFQKKLEKACDTVNKVYSRDLYADFKILKGIDEIEGVLLSIADIYEIINTIQEHIYPYSMRFVLVLDYIEIAIESRDVAKMDGPAFHCASDIIHDLKRSKLIFIMHIGDEIFDKTITGEINLIFMLKKSWSSRQHRIFTEYKESGTQHETAASLGITQQAVSKALNRSMWKEISGIEEDLNHVLRTYAHKIEMEGN